MFRDTCSLWALLSIVATLRVGSRQDCLKAAILVIQSRWYDSFSWLLKAVDCFVHKEKDLVTKVPSFCCLTSLGANKAHALRKYAVFRLTVMQPWMAFHTLRFESSITAIHVLRWIVEVGIGSVI